MDYSEQIKDKRWLLKRLKILKRDKFTCQICEYQGDRVNVHHLKYTGMAWEAPDNDLITLCRECHKTVHLPEINDKKLDKMHIKYIINHGQEIYRHNEMD